MSRAELGRLFPVSISESDPEWPVLFEAEKAVLADSLGAEIAGRIEHVGSTAVPGLVAKPVIDVLLEIAQDADLSLLRERMGALGYEVNERPENPPPCLMFVKGYTPEGYRGQAYHVHVRYPGDWDEIVFRDFLRSHPKDARSYAELKLALAELHRNDREAYTEAKTDFVRDAVRRAREGS